MSVTPECPGCGRPAPAPGSQEGRKWVINLESALCLCPVCAASVEIRQQVEDELNRQRLVNVDNMSVDTIVFVRGKAKVLGDATGADLEWLMEDAKRHEVQAGAWVAWLEAAASYEDE